jgi:hypothetical protein
MKQTLKWCLSLAAAAMIAGNSAADTLLTFKVKQVAESKQPAILCVGDARDPARFGGMATDRTGMASVFVPGQNEDGDYVHTVTVTAFGPDGSTRTTLNLAEMQVSEKDKRFRIAKPRSDGPVELSLSRETNFNCGEARPMSMEALAGKYERAMRAVEDEVIEILEAEGSEVTADLLDRFINDTITTIARYEGTTAILPTAKNAALEEALDQIATAQRKREQNEKLKKFIRDLAAAARARGQERDAAMEQARLERERQEAEEKAKAEQEEIKKKLETCYGAMGPGCGFWAGEGLNITLCGPSILNSVIDGRYQLSCGINTGSWGHDECCTLDENGHWCFGPGQPTASCTDDFNRGFARMMSPFQWERHDVDPTRTNDTGEVEHGLFCAKKGAPMWKSEVDYCCSEKGRNFNFLDGAAFTLAHGAWGFAIPNAQICE